MNKTIRNALISLSRIGVNKFTGLLHPNDKRKTIELFRILLKNNEDFDPIEIRNFLINEEKWEPRFAQDVANVAQGVLEGKKYRRDYGYWAPDAIERWRSLDYGKICEGW